jgi:hypothetical protein
MLWTIMAIFLPLKVKYADLIVKMLIRECGPPKEVLAGFEDYAMVKPFLPN